MMIDVKSDDGRSYDKDVGGWYSSGSNPNWRLGRHVFIATRSITWSTIHEVAHAIDDVLGYPSRLFFKPERALFEYMASNADEYFACAMDAYLHNPRDDTCWNQDNLAKSDFDIFEFIRTLIDMR